MFSGLLSFMEGVQKTSLVGRARRIESMETPRRLRRTHDWIDARSRALAQAIATKVRREPSLLDIALENLARWKERMDPWPRASAEWEEILKEKSLDEILGILVDPSEEGARRRQIESLSRCSDDPRAKRDLPRI